jgi:hypothetical protein
MVRGGLSVTVFEKLLRLREDIGLESRVMTLMFSDIQRIMSSLIYVHELWAGIVETGLATWLLYRQIGVACFAMLGIALSAYNLPLLPLGASVSFPAISTSSDLCSTKSQSPASPVHGFLQNSVVVSSLGSRRSKTDSGQQRRCLLL